MPFLTIEDFEAQTGIQTKPLFTPDMEVESTVVNDPGYIDALDDAFKIDNTIGAALAQEEGQPDIGFAPSKESEEYLQRASDEGFDIDAIDAFAFVENDKQYAALIKQIENEELNRQTIADAGMAGFAASMTAGILDPINAIPIIGVGGKAIKGGASALSAFKKTAIAALPSIAASELTLKELQQLRSEEEVALNIGAGTLLSGMLGAGVAKVVGRRLTKAEKALDDYLKSDKVTGIDDGLNTEMASEDIMKSVGAAETPRATLEQETLLSPPNATKTAAFNMNKASLGKLSPKLRLLDSPIQASRELIQELVDVNLALNKNAEGIASPTSVSSLVRSKESLLLDGTSGHSDIYKAYRKSNKGNSEVLKLSQFNEEVSKAMRTGNHSNPDVMKAAKVWEDKFYGPLKKEASETGLLPDDVDLNGAQRYLNRVYKQEKITQNVSGWKAAIKPHFKQLFARERAAAKEVLKDPKASKVAKDNAREKLSTKLEDSESYINTAIDDVTDKVLGFDQITGIPSIKAADKGLFKDVTFNIPDKFVSEFLENDIELLAGRFFRVVSPQIELKRKFGTTTFNASDRSNPMVAKILGDRDALLETAVDDAARAKIINRAKADLEDIAAVWDINKGTYRARKGKPDDMVRRGLHSIRGLNYILKLGGVVISSANDPVILAYANGMGRFMKANYGLALNKSLRKMNKAQAQRTGKAMNYALNSRSRALYELNDPHARGTAFERGVDNATHKFGNWSGMNFWNDWWESVSTMTHQMRIIDTSIDFATTGKISKSDEVYLSRLGFDAQARKGILKEFEEFGMEFEDGGRVLNTQDWRNQNLAKKVEAGINKGVSEEVIIPTPGDKPIFSEGAIGKSFTQFMSFGFAANEKLLLSGLQKADSSFLAAQMNLMLGGVMVYALKQSLKGREVSEDPTTLFIEALENNPSLVLPLFVNRVADSAGAGLSNFTDDPRRANPKAFMETISGPTSGLITDGFHASQMLLKLSQGENITRRQTRAVRQLIPMNNVFWLRKGFDEAQQGFEDAMGVKRSRQKKK
jgi:hypothetical protein